MSITLQNNSSPIKILILDLFPSYSELNPKDEEILIIFEGLNFFFNLKDLLSTHNKIELVNYNQSSIIVSLIKSNNIIASGNINLKYGEQWVTMNSENKKRPNMNLALCLIDCIKLKIFCEMKIINKNGISANISNINNNTLNLTNINTSINLTNRIANKNKKNINEINLKISKKNTNDKITLKGSPRKSNVDIYATKRSPKNNIYDYNNINYLTKNSFNNNMLKNNFSNLNKNNHQNSIKYTNHFSTLSNHSIKKIDLNPSNKTRNPKINRKSPISSNYTSLKTSNNFGIKKMNTSAFNLNLMNKNKKSRLAPDIEIKELHNAKNLGGSPKLFHKNKLDDDTFQNSENRAFHYGKKNIKKFQLDKNYLRNNINNIDINKTKRKINNNYNNNIMNINYENNNNIINMNIVNNINNNQSRTITDNNYCNFNNTYGNNFNKQDIKSKLLYSSKQNQIYESQPINYVIDRDLNNTKKIKFERSLDSFEYEEEKNINKTKDNIRTSEKINLYTTKRVNIKKNQTHLNKVFKDKNDIPEKILTQKTEENSDYKERNEIDEYNQVNNKEKNVENHEIIESAKEISDVPENNEINEYENNIFERLKEDFLLLYNDDYMNNIQEDLIKLEIELFFEKMTELIQSYHYEYNQKKMEKEIIQNSIKFNYIKNKNVYKLIKNLEIRKIANEMNNKKGKYKQNNDDIDINKNEIKIFKNILNDKDNINNKNLLKDIFNKIIANRNNKNAIDLIDNDKNKILLNNLKTKKLTNFNPDIAYKKKLSISPNYQKNNFKNKNN